MRFVVTMHSGEKIKSNRSWGDQDEKEFQKFLSRVNKKDGTIVSFNKRWGGRVTINVNDIESIEVF